MDTRRSIQEMPDNTEPGCRRAERRFSVQAEAVLTSAGKKRQATVINMSASGVMVHLAVRADVPVGSTVQVEFLRTRQSATVKHVSHARHGVYVGLKFEELPQRTDR